MNELIAAATSWSGFLLGILVICVVFGLLPGLVLRLILLMFPRDSPRRRELVAELRGVPYVERGPWVFEVLELGLTEGIADRVRSLGARLRERRRRKHEREQSARRDIPGVRYNGSFDPDFEDPANRPGQTISGTLSQDEGAKLQLMSPAERARLLLRRRISEKADMAVLLARPRDEDPPADGWISPLR